MNIVSRNIFLWTPFIHLLITIFICFQFYLFTTKLQVEFTNLKGKVSEFEINVGTIIAKMNQMNNLFENNAILINNELVSLKKELVSVNSNLDTIKPLLQNITKALSLQSASLVTIN